MDQMNRKIESIPPICLSQIKMDGARKWFNLQSNLRTSRLAKISTVTVGGIVRTKEEDLFVEKKTSKTTKLFTTTT